MRVLLCKLMYMDGIHNMIWNGYIDLVRYNFIGVGSTYLAVILNTVLSPILFHILLCIHFLTVLFAYDLRI